MKLASARFTILTVLVLMLPTCLATAQENGLGGTADKKPGAFTTGAALQDTGTRPI